MKKFLLSCLVLPLCVFASDEDYYSPYPNIWTHIYAKEYDMSYQELDEIDCYLPEEKLHNLLMKLYIAEKYQDALLIKKLMKKIHKTVECYYAG